MTPPTRGRRRQVRVVGIDGGATRTRYLLADETGGVLRRTEGPGSPLGGEGDRSVGDGLIRQVGILARTAGTELPVDALCAGLAGAASKPEAATALEDQIRQLGVARRARVVPDAEVAFVDAFGDGSGILLLAGTGSIALARSEDGAFHRVGGWGALLGDEGSGYRIGVEGLQAAIRGAEGRGDPTELTELLPRTLELDSVRGLLEWSRGMGKAGVASLAPLVLEAAEGGDPVALALAERAVEGLAGHVVAVRGRLETRRPPTVALSGGLIRMGGPLRERVEAALEAEGFTVLRKPVDPARGAVRLALQL